MTYCFLFIFLGLLLFSTYAQYSLRTCDDLKQLNYRLDYNLSLVNDIDCKGAILYPVGNYVDHAFTGTFHGNNYTISNFQLKGTQPATSYLGFFGIIQHASIRNVKFFNVSIDLPDDIQIHSIGIVVGYANFSMITNVHVERSEIKRAYGWDVGGLAGRIDNSYVTNCSTSITLNISETNGGGLIGDISVSNVTKSFSNVYLTGYGDLGGLIGRVDDGAFVIECYASGTVISSFNGAGGLIGLLWNGTILRSFSSGFVAGASFIGGLVGNAYTGLISDSYSNATVTASEGFLGGLVGSTGFAFNLITLNKTLATGIIKYTGTTGPVGGLTSTAGLGSEILFSYWDIETSGTEKSDGGDGRTTKELLTQSTYRHWDFNTIWNMIDGQTYPWLRFQNESFVVEKL